MGNGLRTLVNDYLEELEISGKAERTVQRYGAYLDAFLVWLSSASHVEAQQLSCSDLTAERLHQYRLFLARRRDRRDGELIGPATRNLYQIALRNFLRYATRRGELKIGDMERHLELSKRRDIAVRHLERADVMRILKAISDDKPTALRDRAIVQTLFGTGCRVSELVTMTRRQIDLERREAEVIGKGGRSRLILLTREAAAAIRRYLDSRADQSDVLFLSNRTDADGLPVALTVRQVHNIVESAGKRAGLPFRVSPHWFRHGRLTIVARHLGVQAAQRVAGHASLQTTSRYLHVTDRFLRAGYDEAERAEGGN